MSFEAKIQDVDRRLRRLGKVAVAFSGGVDSTALLHACRRVLGREKVLAVTADSESFPRHEREEAVALASRLDVEHLFVSTREIENPDYRRNEPDRCYFCKRELFAVMERIAGERAVDSLAYGAIADDLRDFRPGAQAAREFRVVAPLQEAGLGKEEIREYSRRFGLPTAGKPSFACLASRIPHGTEVTAEALGRVERAESVLRDLGFRQYRVRHHGEIARIELDPEEIPRALGEARTRILAGVRSAGYRTAALDLRGYRRPSESPEEESPADDCFWGGFPSRSVAGFALLDPIDAERFETIRARLEAGSRPSFPLALILG